MTYHPVDSNDDGIVDADVDNQSVSTGELNNTLYVAPSLSGAYDTISAAFTAAEPGDTIHLLEDVTEGNIVLDSPVHIKAGRRALSSAGTPTDINIPSGENGVTIAHREVVIEPAINVIGPGDGTCAYGIDFDGTTSSQKESRIGATVHNVTGGPGIRFKGVLSQNEFDLTVRDCDIGIDFSQMAASGFFNANVCRFDLRGNANAAVELSGNDTDSSFSGNHVTLRFENNGQGFNVQNGEFLYNEFHGYGIENSTSVSTFQPDNGQRNKWFAGRTAGYDFSDDVWVKVAEKDTNLQGGTVTHATSGRQGLKDAVYTASVGTSATTIADLSAHNGSMAVVSGEDNANAPTKFTDILAWNRVSSPVVVANNDGNNPATRTYTRSAGDLELAMASGDYDVTVVAIGGELA